MKQFRKKNQGITLIALIITIVIMLILSGVTVNILINSNLISKAQDTADEIKEAYEKESNISEDITVGGKKYDSINAYIYENLVLPQNAGKKYNTDGDYNDGNKIAKIPAGFTVSGEPTECTINGGLVIYLIDDMSNEEIENIKWYDPTVMENLKKTYDQFVWIPIKNTTDKYAQDINDMYICQNKGTGSHTGECTITLGEVDGKEVAICEKHGNCTKMAGNMYTDAEMTTKVSRYTANSNRREPDIVTGNTTGDGTSYDGAKTTNGGTTYTNLSKISTILNDNTNYADLTKWKNALQTEYNDIVKSVYENQGFYVGRYETSGMKNATSGYNIKIVAGSNNETNGNISLVDWYYMYAQQKDYAKKNELDAKSAMIQGTAYDQILLFADPNKTWITSDDTGRVGHSATQGAGSLYQTGGVNYKTKTDDMTDYIAYNDVAKNIYDLEGNLMVVTTGAYSNGYRVNRGRKLQPNSFRIWS